jgi:hypothetical protein
MLQQTQVFPQIRHPIRKIKKLLRCYRRPRLHMDSPETICRYGLTKEFGHLGEVWQRGFSEVQVLGRESFMRHRAYIAANPVKAGLVESSEQYPYCF